MNKHESDYDIYRRKVKRIRIVVVTVAVIGFFAYVAGPLAHRVKNGGPGLYDLIREKTGVEAIEYYMDEAKDRLDDGDAEIVDYAVKSDFRPVYKGNTLSVDDEAGRISCSNGKFTDDFRNVIKGSTALNYQMNCDASELVIESGDTLYHIDAQLNMTVIAEDVYNYRLCHDGGMVGYITKGDHCLYLYDVETGESTLIDKNVYTHEISPNGRYMLYERDGIDARYLSVTDTQTTDKTIISRDIKHVMPLFVSTDGNTAYYYTFEGNNEKYTDADVYCFHDGKEIKVYSGGHVHYYTNITCEEIMFWDSKDKYVIYFNPAMKKGARYLQMDYEGFAPQFSTVPYGRNVIVDCNSLREGMHYKTRIG